MEIKRFITADGKVYMSKEEACVCGYEAAIEATISLTNREIEDVWAEREEAIKEMARQEILEKAKDMLPKGLPAEDDIAKGIASSIVEDVYDTGCELDWCLTRGDYGNFDFYLQDELENHDLSLDWLDIAPRKGGDH